MYFIWSVCVLLFLLCCFYFLNKLDPSILVWERDTLRFFMWILIFFTYIFWVFLSSYCYAFSSCFSCISFRAVNSCGKYSLVSFVNYLESCLVDVLVQKMLHVVDDISKRHSYRSLSCFIAILFRESLCWIILVFVWK